MSKYIIEVTHGGDRTSCIQAIQVFLSSRNHYVSSAEWGCNNNENKAWLIVESENKETALRVLPAAYQHSAKITKLHKFSEKNILENMPNQTT